MRPSALIRVKPSIGLTEPWHAALALLPWANVSRRSQKTIPAGLGGLMKPWPAVVETAQSVYDIARQQVYEEMAGAGELNLTPAECRELFSMWLAHSIQPPEIDPSHPSYTGAMKLGAMQPDEP